MGAGAASKKHRGLLSIVVEDYFQARTFRELIPPEQWYRFQSRLEESTLKLLDLLGQSGAQATFFVFAPVAEQHRDLVREVAQRGHEVASRSYDVRNAGVLSEGELRAELARSREAVQRASGRRVYGHWNAEERGGSADSKTGALLVEAGYAYQCAIPPRFGTVRRPAAIHAVRYPQGVLWEVPVSSCAVLGFNLPIGAGSWLRRLPVGLTRQAIRHWRLRHQDAFVLNFHLWEFDPAQPRISGASLQARRAHYQHLERSCRILEECLESYQFTGIAKHLGLEAGAEQPGLGIEWSEAPGKGEAPRQKIGSRKAVTIVIPCFNEQEVIPYLANTLEGLQASLDADYELEFLFVDDGSSDGTAEQLEATFGGRPDYRVVRHGRNQGVAAAILTGLREAKTEIVCSIDSDCSYDPLQLKGMIPLLREGVDMVTASPYHPQGRVGNVPAWRLKLSQSASVLYRSLLRNKLFTYTSCFRVYRKSALNGLRVKRGRFLGVTEMLARLDQQGSRIVEYPATLEARLLGHSKMKVLRTIVGHLGLMAELLVARIRGPGRGGRLGLE
jgi:polysaccharide deacetylase family protein (PEP-CTERM system associated)